MSILKKVNAQIKFPGRDSLVDASPYHVNILNALEEVTGVKHTDGKLNQITAKYWEFEWTTPKGTGWASVHMTDESLDDQWREKSAPTGKRLAPPRFK